MAEETRIQRIEIDSSGNRQLSMVRRAGGMKHVFKQTWSTAWQEAESLERAAAAVNLPKEAKAGCNLPPTLDPARLLHRQRPLFDALAALDVEQWVVVIRSFRQCRRIIKGSGKEHCAISCHDGLHVRVRVHTGEKEIELGDGRIPGESFNRDGLLQRLNAIIDNHRSARPLNGSLALPVVLAAGDGGIIWHELMGHSLEADHVLAGDSPLTGRDIGHRVMSRAVTLSARCATDPFVPPDLRDDEGEVCRHPHLIQEGVLRHFICDRDTGRRLAVSERGHARQEGFDRPVLPRMFALYLQPGSLSPEDILRSIKRGIYAAEFGLGRVLFRKGRFAFHIPSAFLIEHGRLGPALGPVTVQGSMDTAFQAVSMVGDDFRLDRGVSFCHKKGQTLHVRVGQPTVRVDGLTISSGGT